MPKKISKGPTIVFDPVLDLPGLIWILVQAKLEKILEPLVMIVRVMIGVKKP